MINHSISISFRIISLIWIRRGGKNEAVKFSSFIAYKMNGVLNAIYQPFSELFRANVRISKN